MIGNHAVLVGEGEMEQHCCLSGWRFCAAWARATSASRQHRFDMLYRLNNIIILQHCPILANLCADDCDKTFELTGGSILSRACPENEVLE